MLNILKSPEDLNCINLIKYFVGDEKWQKTFKISKNYIILIIYLNKTNTKQI